jgi:hypothetical protein
MEEYLDETTIREISTFIPHSWVCSGNPCQQCGQIVCPMDICNIDDCENLICFGCATACWGCGKKIYACVDCVSTFYCDICEGVCFGTACQRYFVGCDAGECDNRVCNIDSCSIECDEDDCSNRICFACSGVVTKCSTHQE